MAKFWSHVTGTQSQPIGHISHTTQNHHKRILDNKITQINSNHHKRITKNHHKVSFNHYKIITDEAQSIEMKTRLVGDSHGGLLAASLALCCVATTDSKWLRLNQNYGYFFSFRVSSWFAGSGFCDLKATKLYLRLEEFRWETESLPWVTRGL